MPLSENLDGPFSVTGILISDTLTTAHLKPYINQGPILKHRSIKFVEQELFL